MKYELIKTDISAERTVYQDVVTVVDEVETVTKEPTDNYEVTITLGLHPVDGIAPDFSKDIVVTSNNSTTGFQVDDQREQEVQAFMDSINL